MKTVATSVSCPADCSFVNRGQAHPHRGVPGEGCRSLLEQLRGAVEPSRTKRGIGLLDENRGIGRHAS